MCVFFSHPSRRPIVRLLLRGWRGVGVLYSIFPIKKEQNIIVICIIFSPHGHGARNAADGQRRRSPNDVAFRDGTELISDQTRTIRSAVFNFFYVCENKYITPSALKRLLAKTNKAIPVCVHTAARFRRVIYVCTAYKMVVVKTSARPDTVRSVWMEVPTQKAISSLAEHARNSMIRVSTGSLRKAFPAKCTKQTRWRRGLTVQGRTRLAWTN